MLRMKIIRIALVLFAAFAFVGCGPKADMIMGVQAVQSEGRFRVSRVGVFDDQLAYGGSRGIYVIIDTKTGREYIGVSGIGISELGSHSAGKSSISDER